MINIALSRTFSRALPICGVVSILPRVDLLENTEVDWFCIFSLFRLDTLSFTMIENCKFRTLVYRSKEDRYFRSSDIGALMCPTTMVTQCTEGRNNPPRKDLAPRDYNTYEIETRVRICYAPRANNPGVITCNIHCVCDSFDYVSYKNPQFAIRRISHSKSDGKFMIDQLQTPLLTR